MNATTHREFKDRLFEQFARVGKALASPRRLEIVDLLAQGERTVGEIARETAMSVASASQHLQALKAASRSLLRFCYVGAASERSAFACLGGARRAPNS